MSVRLFAPFQGVHYATKPGKSCQIVDAPTPTLSSRYRRLGSAKKQTFGTLITAFRMPQNTPVKRRPERDTCD
jgi:hypothetical protein